MTDPVFADGTPCVSSADAAQRAGLSRDYVARLCHDGKVRGRQIGKNWYVDEKSLGHFLSEQARAKEERAVELRDAYEKNARVTREAFSGAITVAPPSTLHAHVSQLRMQAARRAALTTGIATATLVFTLAAGAAAFVAPDASRTASVRAQSELAAAAANPGGFLSALGDGTASLARSFATRIDDFIFGVALPNPTLTYYRAQGDTTSNIPSVPSSTTEVGAATSAPPTSTATLPSSPRATTTINQPVIERVVQTDRVVTQDGITENILDQRLGLLQDQVTSQINALSLSNSAQLLGAYQAASYVPPSSNSNAGASQAATAWGAITGTLANQTDLQNALTAKLSLSDWYATSTDGLKEGTGNLYFTDARVGDFVNSSSTIAKTYANNTFTGNDTFANATTTNLFSTTASSTNLFAQAASFGALGVTGTTTLAGINLSTENCSSFGNGGKLTTDAFGDIVCAADQGGSGSTVAGSDTQVQFNSGGSRGASTNFTFSSSTNKLTVTNASTSNLVASNSFTLGTFNGFLKATAGAVATSLVNLASDVTGILPVANGGTGWSNIAAGAIPYGNGSGALATTSAGAAGYVLAYLNGVPTWTATTTLATISGTLGVSNGGTGATTLTGLVKGNGTSAFTAAAAGTDYVAPATTLTAGTGLSGGGDLSTNRTLSLNLGNANTWTALQQFANASTSVESAYQAFFGATATSSFSSTGALTLASPLAAGSGGTGIASPAAAGILFGSYAGATWQQIATSSLGLPTFADLTSNLASYLPLSSWYATTTNGLTEGSSNLYFTTNRVANVIAGTTTDALKEGASNVYFTNGRVQSYLDTLGKGYFFSTTSSAYFLSLNQGAAFSTSSAAYFLEQNQPLAFSTSSASYFLSQSQSVAFATTSSDFWLSTKSTSNLAEGLNLYFTNARAENAISVSGAPLTYSSGLIGINQANGSQAGYLAAADWTNFNNKIASTSLSAGTGISYNSATGAIVNTGITSNTGDWAGTFGGDTPSYYLNNSFSTTSASYFLSQNQPLAFSTSSASYFLSRNQGNAYATSSADYWLSTKTADNLPEGSTNLYWTNTRFDTRLAATTTLPNITTLANLASVGTITSGTWNGSILGVPYGGTGWSNITSGTVLLGNGAAAVATTTRNNLLVGSNLSISGGSNALLGADATISLGGNVVTSVANDANVTGSIASNALTLGWTGILGVVRGGTASSTLSGLLKGNGTSAIQTAVGGTDYEFPLTFSAGLNRSGNTITNTGVLSLGSGFATTTGTTISFTTSTVTTNGQTLGLTIVPSAGSLLFTPTISGTLDNTGLTHPSLTVNGTPISLGSSGTITAASSTLLADNNTFLGTNSFSSTITGNISGNAGTVTNGVYTTTFGGLFDIRLSATSTLPSITTLANLATVGTIGTGVWSATKIGLAYGGTNVDLSATGGASQVLRQSASGAAITVGQLAASDLSNGTTGIGAVALAGSPTLTGKITLAAASSTDLTASASLYTPITSALLLADANKLTTAYGGSGACSNQFVRSINGAGVATCASVSNSDFNGQLSAAHGGTGIDTSGSSGIAVVDSGVWSASSTLATYRGGTGATSLTAGQVLVGSGTGAITSTSTANLKSSLGLNNVENTALSTWAGSTNITTLGTITTGTWSGLFGAVTGANLTNLTAANITGSHTLPDGVLSTNVPLLNAANAFTNTGNNTFAGNVGIGTASPSQKLTVQDSGNGNTFSNIANFYANNLTAGVGIGFEGISAIGSNTNNNLTLDAKGTGNIELNANGGTGNVGIGTTNPYNSLDVASTVNFRTLLYVGAGSTNPSTTGASFTAFNWDGTNNAGMIQAQTTNTAWRNLELNPNGGNVGIGVSPSFLLDVWSPSGTDAVISATTQNGVNNAQLRLTTNGQNTWTETANRSTGHLEFSSAGGGGVYLASGGTSWNSLSDQRLKTNITTLASSSLDQILALNPVTFNWRDANQNAEVGTQLGFIAQEVQQIFPQLVSTGGTTIIVNADSSTTIVTNTLGLNYTGLIVPLVKAVQDIANLSDTFKTNLIAWLGNESNGIDELFANVGNFQTVNSTTDNTQKLCVTTGPSDQSPVCVTKAQLTALLSQSASAGFANPTPSSFAPTSASDPTSEVGSTEATDTPPVIAINGDNPAHVNVGDTYQDLGATVTGPQADLNLGISIFLNGQLVSNILVDTSAVATDTIDYVATDSAGNAATSTRTVIIESPSIAPLTDATRTTPTQ